ncbi:hypothetical protein CR513_46577, partial [Mucuna pruriens]
MDVYGLLVYGIMLIPHIEDYMDLAGMDAFLAKRDRGENPVIAILANTYYSLNYCYERNGKGLRCGGFPNVPLIGTQGAINYNLELVLKQAGYPMALPPSNEAIIPFVIHDLRVQNGECLKKIRQAWRSVVRKGPEWGPWSCGASSSYKAWLKNRLEQWKLTSNLEHLGREDANKRVCIEKESWSRAIAQERYFKEIERDQALVEKEKLKAALVESRYATHSMTRAMENNVEVLEQQNQDLKGEVSQLKEQMTQMFQILSQINVAIIVMANQGEIGHAQPNCTNGPPPYGARDLPYRMPYVENRGPYHRRTRAAECHLQQND